MEVAVIYGQFPQVNREWFLKCGQVVLVAALAVAVCKVKAAMPEAMQNIQCLLLLENLLVFAPAEQVVAQQIIYADIVDAYPQHAVILTTGVHAKQVDIAWIETFVSWVYNVIAVVQHACVVVDYNITMVADNYVCCTSRMVILQRTKPLSFVMITHINIWGVHMVIRLTKDRKVRQLAVKVVMAVSAAAIQAVVVQHVTSLHINQAVVE